MDKKDKKKKPRKIPQQYVPKSLTPEDKKKQVKSILEKKKRPKVESFKSKRSNWVIKFENKYNKKITDKKWISKNLISMTGINKILDKGKGAYYSAGSRPNQNMFSWSNARLASALLGGASERIDKDILFKYGIGEFKEKIRKKYFNKK